MGARTHPAVFCMRVEGCSVWCLDRFVSGAVKAEKQKQTKRATRCKSKRAPSLREKREECFLCQDRKPPAGGFPELARKRIPMKIILCVRYLRGGRGVKKVYSRAYTIIRAGGGRTSLCSLTS